MQEEIIYSLLMPAANRCACFCVQVVGFHNLLISAGRWCGLSSELSESHTCCFAPSHCKKNTTTHRYTLKITTPDRTSSTTRTHLALKRSLLSTILRDQTARPSLISVLLAVFPVTHTHTTLPTPLMKSGN